MVGLVENRPWSAQDGRMVALIIVLAVLVGGLGAVFWNVLRAEPNTGP
jgi:hypothetical protein